MIIERNKLGENPRTLPVNKMEIRVHVFDLKIGFMSERVLKVTGDYIGKFVASCSKNFIEILQDYLRVRVLNYINKLLKRRMKIQRNKDEGF